MVLDAKEALIRAFHSSLLQQERYSRINQARKQAEAILGVAIAPGHPLTKVVDEAMEAAVVRLAPQLIAQSETTHQAYDQLVDLLNRQPTLSSRSSTSVLQQAYSTPIPIAYLASTLVRITPETTVYEPTAGNGALLIATNPANVIANELNSDRFQELQQRGYHQLTQQDASTYRPADWVDVVICNPPFGVVHGEDKQVRRFVLPGNQRGTRQIDQAIAFKALEVMKDQGRAVLILGGKLGEDEALRSERYNSIESRGFFYALYQQYNVTQHFSIWGDLYRKQGAGYPIDLIVIEGRGASQRDLPASDVPVIYKSFETLKEQLPNEPIHQHSGNLGGVPPLSSGLATGDGRASAPNGQATSRNADAPRIRLPPADATANSVVNSSLAGAEWRKPDRDPSATEQSLAVPLCSGSTQPLRELGQSGTRTSVVVDPGVGGHLPGAQRNLQSSIGRDGAGFSDSPPFSRSAASDGIEPGTRPLPLRELALRPDLWHDRQLAPDQASEPEIQTMVTPDNERPHQDAPLNVAYLPRSQGRSPGTLIPANMATAAQTALDNLEQAVGDIDEFVRQRMGYASKPEMWQFLYAEQIDANALAFWQRDRGKGFLNGDQTGNGKGRFCASQIVDAMTQGYIPIFVTQKPNLYVSMLEDLADIGKRRINLFITNSRTPLELPDGRKLSSLSPAEKQTEMEQILSRGMGSYQAIFTTYSQLQTIDNGQEPFRREFLRAIAPGAVFIFDEAHEAGGSVGEKPWKSIQAAPDRSEFVRELVNLSAGVVFASATAVKDPAVMDLYARRSDAAEAVSNIASLQRTLKEGGVPLQQMMATKFVASGQMLRRERSFEGVSFQAKVVAVDRGVADGISAIMRAISRFDLVKEKAVEKLSKQLKKEAKAASEDSSIGKTGARSMNFTSLMGNVIDQGLLCQKAEATVQEAIAAMQRGQKPVIAVANTMEAFISQYADDHNLSPGDAIDISFGDVLRRYLERSRDVTIKDHEGKSIRRRMFDDELGPEALAAYDDARERIEATDLSTIPLSSIDYIKWRLTQEGYRIGEITGRQHIIDYNSAGEQGYSRRSAREVTPQAKVEVVNQFNQGDLDLLILNRSGATGINLHASEKFADQQQRHLIVAQAERDINQVMQMLGRVNRFGQVVEPEITLLMSDLPAEKRLGAILSKKMATLNANTTADRDSALSIANVVDFLNPYGEEVILDILEDRPELEAKLSYPSKGLQGDHNTELISRVTGRIPLLSVQEQEELYQLIESETLDLIAQKQAMGESVLEAQQLDLEARTLARMEVIPDESPVHNEFTGPVYLDVVDAKVPTKPFSQLEVINRVRETLKLEPMKDIAQHEFERVERRAKDQSNETLQQLRQSVNQYRAAILKTKDLGYDGNKLTDRLKQQLLHVSQILREFPPGQTVRVVSPEGNITYGVVARVWQKGHNGSPAAPTNWRAEILTDNHARIITIPLTRLNRGKDDQMTTVTAQETNWEGQDIYAAFDLRQQTERTERQIFQGNLLKAYEKYPNGKFVNFTDHQGHVCQGLIMPASFDIQESLRNEPVAFREPHQVKAFLTEITQFQGAVKTLDEVLTLKSQMAARFGSAATGFLLQTPKSAEGDRFSLDQSIIAAVESDFYSVGDRMEVVIPVDRLEAVLQILMKEQKHTLAAFDFKDRARNYLGIQLPEMQPIENPEAVHSPIAELAESSSRDSPIATPQHQSGGAEKNIAKFLHDSDLAEAVLEAEDFHLRIEHSPYSPLVVEQHGRELFLTHYLEQNGDLFIDAELVFQIHPNGQLHLQETATQDPLRGGECRACDRGFAQLFSRNILHQGFAEAALAQQQSLQSFLSPLHPNSLDSPAQVMSAPHSPTPETPEPNPEVIEQSPLFSITQYEVNPALLDSTPGFDQSWTTWEQQPQTPQSGEHQPSPHRELDTVTNPAAQHSATTWKQLADQVREFPLPELAQQFGLEQDKSDKAKWRMDGFCISINGSKFFDHYTDQGGVGAIDFTMYIRDCSFQDAVEILSHERPAAVTHPHPPEEKLPKCNIRDESRWEAARSYLIDQRGLPSELVDGLHDRGLISVDSRQNLMFFRHQVSDHLERGDAIGANLRGTIPNSVTGEFFKGLTPGTTREDGYFWFRWGEGNAKQVVIVESPIDALSYVALHEPKATTLLLSTDGQGAIPLSALQQVLNQGGTLVLAHDLDRQGDRMAWQVTQQFPDTQLIRETPAIGKDWNDQLRGKTVTEPDPRQPLADQLWQWYQVARDEERISIRQIGLEFNAANKPRDLTPAELATLQQAIAPTPIPPQTQPVSLETQRNWAAEILRIAEQAYAYGESLGRLKAEADTWVVAGNDYTLSYNPLTLEFGVEGRNGMLLHSLNGAITTESLETISELDLIVFQETECRLAQKGFTTEQSPAQTQAIAQSKEEQPYPPAPSSPPPPSPLSPQPKIEDLRQWYRQSRDLGRSEAHLIQIEQVGKALVQGQPLSERSLQAMAADQIAWNHQVETICAHSRAILSHIGQPLNSGIAFMGKQYTLYAQDDYLYVLATGRGKQPDEGDRQVLPEQLLDLRSGIILKLEQGKITQASRVTSSDAVQFERFAERARQQEVEGKQREEGDR